MFSIFSFLFGILLGAWNNFQGWGSVADWISGLGSVAAIIFAFFQIGINRKQFKKVHQAKLQVYSTWKDSLKIRKDNKSGNADVEVPGPVLHIVPVNIGLADGIYRYLGICQKQNIEQIKELMYKAKIGIINEKEKIAVIEAICFDVEDIGEEVSYHDITGLGLLYPDDNQIYQTIKSNKVGKIENKSIKDIEKKLHTNKNLAILYTDPSMNLYIFAVANINEQD